MYQKDRHEGNESRVDVQIIRIKSERTSLFNELEQTLKQQFASLQQPHVSTKIYWEDHEGDRIHVKDQYGFLLAIDKMSGPPYKLFVVFETTEANG